jgi:hypothetical protein
LGPAWSSGSFAGADQVSARLVGAGIAEAFISTEAGLCIAIPVQMFHNYYVSRIDRFTTEMEELHDLTGSRVQGDPDRLHRRHRLSLDHLLHGYDHLSGGAGTPGGPSVRLVGRESPAAEGGPHLLRADQLISITVEPPPGRAAGP